MPVRVVKEFDLELNLVASVPFTAMSQRFVTFISGKFPSFINIRSLHFRHDLSHPNTFYVANDGYYKSIFSKLLGQELPDSISSDIYLRYLMDFTSNAVRTEAPNFVNLGLPDVNASNEFNTFGTPATRFKRLMYGPHWSAPDHVLGEAMAVGISGTRSKIDYSFKNGFQNWRGNQDFGHQNNAIS